MSRQALGRGLEALIPSARKTNEDPVTVARASSEEGFREVSLDQIRPNPKQPRHHIDESALQELEASIRTQGILQPLLVRPHGDGFELIAGERRYLASKRAGLQVVPVVIRNIDDRFVLEASLVENLQREDLDPIDEALGYQALMEELAYTQEKVAERVGKDRTTITNALRLLTLPQGVQDLVSRGTLSAGHARAILPLTSADDLENASRYIVSMGFSVRKTEAFVARKLRRRIQARKRAGKKSNVAPVNDTALAAVEENLRRRFSTQVRILPQGEGGKIEIEFYSQPELERLLEMWGAL